MIVIARGYGQLGNRLFLYSHLIAAARHYGVPLANPCFAQYAHLFPSTANDLWCRYPRQPIPTQPPTLRTRRILERTITRATRTLPSRGLAPLPLEVIRIKGDQACDLAGHRFAKAAQSDRHLLTQGWLFRSEPLLMKHSDAVREHFRLPRRQQERVEQRIESIRQQSDVIVGVHVRLGDYAKYLNGKYLFSIQQYVRAMRDIERQFPDRRVAFFVCSNVQLDWGNFGGLQVHMGPGDTIEDMYGLAGTDLIIGPPSTYTGWASFYGEVPLIQMDGKDQPIEIPAMPLGIDPNTGFDLSSEEDAPMKSAHPQKVTHLLR